MVLINDDQGIIADIVLALWVKLKNLNHPNVLHLFVGIARTYHQTFFSKKSRFAAVLILFLKTYFYFFSYHAWKPKKIVLISNMKKYDIKTDPRE